jgi:hypothetical protein
MKKLICNIRIGKYSFDHVVELTVNTSIDQLTDTCTIEIPSKLSWKGKTIALGEDGLIHTGDRVIVKTGYDKTLETSFKGYLKHIKPGVRVKLTCENEMYKLKSAVINRSVKTTTIDPSKKKHKKTTTFSVVNATYVNITLKELLQDILPSDMEFRAIDINLGTIIINDMSVAKILEKLQSDFGLISYFLDDVLYSGFAYWPENAKTHKLEFKKNIIDDSGLEFIREEDVKIRVKAVSILKNNTKIEKEFGDADGDLRTVHFYNVPAASLQKVAEEEIKKLKYTGLQGSMMLFGEPYILKGDVVDITDPDYPEKDGNYLVKSVEYQFGTRGYRQKIELGPKV